MAGIIYNVKRAVDYSIRPFFVIVTLSCIFFIAWLSLFASTIEKTRYLGPSSIVLAAFLATTGWLWTGHLNRKLNRKQQAVSLLLAIRQPHVQEWKKVVYDYIERISAEAKSEEEKVENNRLKECVPIEADFLLGYYEFISISVMNGTTDEDIVKESQKYVFLRLHEGLGEYIKKTQKDEVSIYCHFCEYAEAWNNKKKTPSFVRKT